MFRRKPSLPPPDPYYAQPYTYRYEPSYDLRPQPWRSWQGAFHLPVEFVLRFADRDYLERVRRVEWQKCDFLRKSMEIEGIHTPAIMKIDPDGKLRFHDGYHRLAVCTDDPGRFPMIPVVLHRTNQKIKGYGRLVSEEVDFLLDWVSRHRP